MSFADHLNGLDLAVFDHLGEPVSGEGIASAARAIIERPGEQTVLRDSGFVRSKPQMQLPVIWAASLRKSQEVTCEDRRWRVAEAPTRPGDGRVWEVVVEDLGPAA